MSANFCQTAVAPSVQFGRRFAGMKALSATEMATRNDADNALVTLEVATPTANAHAATKLYVDNAVNGLNWKTASRVCSTVDVTIAAPGANIDGVAMVLGDRVALKAQGTASQNGLWEYDTAATPLVRPTDWAVGSDQSGSAFFVQEGTCADEAYVATADPAIVDTDDPVLVLFGSITPGVTSVNDAVAVPAGGSSLIGSGGSGAVTLNVLGDSSQIAVDIAANVITYSIVANSVNTADLAANAVGNAQLAPNTAVSCIRGTIVFGDAGSTVNIGTIPANSEIVSASVRVTTAFNQTDVVANVRVNAVSVNSNTDNDLNAVNIYECDNPVDEVGTVDVVVGASAGLVAGAATICVNYIRTA